MPESESPDIQLKIRIGTVPRALRTPTAYGALYEASFDEFLLRVDGIGRFYVRKGEQITIQPASGVTEHELRVFLLSSCFGVALRQRGLFVMHASAIVTSLDDGIIFAGACASGKSTLLAAMLQSGHRMLADDISALNVSVSGTINVLSGWGMLSLWPDSLGKLGLRTEGLTPIREGLPRYAVSVGNQFHDNNVRLRKIYILNPREEETSSFIRLRGADALRGVLGQTYRPEISRGLNCQWMSFSQAASIARSVDVFRLSRPRYPFCLDKLVSELEQHISHSYHRGV